MTHPTPRAKRIAWMLLLVVLSMTYIEARAQTFQAEGDGVKVVVYADEKCAIPAVSNLPYKATWTENGKTVEGCAGVHPMGIVLFYFASDRTVVPIPKSQFVKVVGA